MEREEDLGLERAKILNLDLNFEEWRELLVLGLGLFFKRGGESLIWRILSLFE